MDFAFAALNVASKTPLYRSRASRSVVLPCLCCTQRRTALPLPHNTMHGVSMDNYALAPLDDATTRLASPWRCREEPRYASPLLRLSMRDFAFALL